MVKTNIRKWKQNVVIYATCAILVASVSYADNANKARQLVAGDKAKVAGTIVSRDGACRRKYHGQHQDRTQEPHCSIFSPHRLLEADEVGWRDRLGTLMYENTSCPIRQQNR